MKKLIILSLTLFSLNSFCLDANTDTQVQPVNQVTDSQNTQAQPTESLAAKKQIKDIGLFIFIFAICLLLFLSTQMNLFSFNDQITRLHYFLISIATFAGFGSIELYLGSHPLAQEGLLKLSVLLFIPLMWIDLSALMNRLRDFTDSTDLSTSFSIAIPAQVCAFILALFPSFSALENLPKPIQLLVQIPLLIGAVISFYYRIRCLFKPSL